MKRWLKVAIAIGLFAVLLSFVDWRASSALLLGVSVIPVLLALSTLLFGIILSSLKWRILVKALGLLISAFDLVRYYWIGSFFSNYFPSTVGGDIVRLTVMRRVGRLAEIAASIILERLTGFIVLLCFAAMALWARPEYFAAAGLSALLWVLVGGFSAGLILVAILGRRIIDRFSVVPTKEGTFLEQILGKCKKVAVSIGYYHDRKGSLLFALLLSVPFYASTVLFQYLLFVSLGLHVALLEVLFIAPLIPLVSLIPISVNALGIAEGAFVLFYSQAGLLPEEAFAAALLRRVLHLMVSLVGGVFWLLNRSE